MESERSKAQSELVGLSIRSLKIMADGDLADFADVVHPEAVNRESRAEPPATRGRGPEAFFATALWLRAAYDDLAFDVDEVVVEGDLAVTHVTMSGRHVRPFVVFDADARVEHAFAPTGKTFAVTQTHWLRCRDGKVIEHWANRDDTGQSIQLGWVPPTPLYLLRSAVATRRARKEFRQ